MERTLRQDGKNPKWWDVLWTVPLANEVKQDCEMAATLFIMMFSAMFTDAFQECADGFPSRYRFDYKLFNLKRLQAKTMVQTIVYWRHIRITIIHQGPDQGDKSPALTREVNLKTPSSAPSAEEVRESGI